MPKSKDHILTRSITERSIRTSRWWWWWW